MRIVLDTNVILGDAAMGGGHFSLLKEYVRRTDAKVIIPRVVLQEALRKLREEAMDVAHSAETVAKRWGELADMRAVADDAAVLLAPDTLQRLAAEFEQRLRDLQADFVDIPQVSHQSLVDALLARRRPFSDDGRGYRDALIWCTVVQAATDGAEVAFITGDSHFPTGKDGEMHDDLRAWATEASSDPSRIRLFRSLGEFAKAEILPHLPQVRLSHAVQVEAVVVRAIGERQDDFLAPALAAIKAASGGGAASGPRVVGLPAVSAEAAQIGDPEIEVGDARRLGAGTVVVSARARYRFRVSVFQPPEPVPPFKGYVWVMHPPEVYDWGITARVSVTLDEATGQSVAVGVMSWDTEALTAGPASHTEG